MEIEEKAGEKMNKDTEKKEETKSNRSQSPSRSNSNDPMDNELPVKSPIKPNESDEISNTKDGNLTIDQNGQTKKYIIPTQIQKDEEENQ